MDLKSFIAKLFSSPVFNADKEVNYLYKNSIKSKNVLQKLKNQKLKNQIPKFVKSFPISKKELIAAINHNNQKFKNIINCTSIGTKKNEYFFKKK